MTTASMTDTNGTTAYREGRREGMSKLLLTSEEVAEVLGIGRSKVFELLAAGQLRSVKIGRCRRIAAATLTQFVASLEAEADD